MGKIKEYMLDILQIIEELKNEGLSEEELDTAIQEDLTGDQYYFYMENREFILQMAEQMAEEVDTPEVYESLDNEILMEEIDYEEESEYEEDDLSDQDMRDMYLDAKRRGY